MTEIEEAHAIYLKASSSWAWGPPSHTAARRTPLGPPPTQHSKLAASLVLTCRVMGYSALTHTAFAAGDSDNRELISNASVVRQKSR
jgi:hypothetical protein